MTPRKKSNGRAKWALNPDAVIDDQKLRKILEALRSDKARRHLYLAFLIVGNMGWRIGEVVHIRVDSIDLRKRQIEKLVLKKKGEKPHRATRTIHKAVVPMLAQFIGRRQEGWLFDSTGSTTCDVFTKPPQRKKYSCPGGHTCKRTFQAGFKAACDAAGLPPVKGRGIHSLRHCFALRAAEVLDPFKLRDALDHSDVSTTNVYVDRVNERKNLDKLGSVS